MGCPFKALADNKRREILRLISKKELQVGEIASNFNLSKSVIFNHLKILLEADLIVNNRDKQFITYSVNKLRVNTVIEFIEKLLE